MKTIAAACLIVTFFALSSSAEWPAALLPPGVRSENAPPGGMCFPVLLSEIAAPLKQTAAPEQLPPAALAFSPDHASLAAWLPDGRLLLQSIYKNKLLWEQPVMAPLKGLAFSPDGKTILGLGSQAVIFFDAETGRELNRLSPAASLLQDTCTFRPLDGKRFLLLSSGKSDTPLLQIIDTDGNASPAVPRPKGRTILATAFSQGNVFLLAQALETGSNGEKNYEVIAYQVEQKAYDTLHTFKGPAAKTGDVSLSADGATVAVAIPGLMPFIFQRGAAPAKTTPLLISDSLFWTVSADAPQAILFAGTIGVNAAEEPPPHPTDIVSLDAQTGKKWRLTGRFVQGGIATSRNGRWIAVLADELPARGSRGKGLVLLDNQRPGKGDQRIAYTFSTKTTPLGPLVMAADGSAIAFPEWRAAESPDKTPALVINVIR